MKIFTSLIVVLWICSADVFSQNIDIRPLPGRTPVCTGEFIKYTATNFSDSSCEFNWNVINGVIQESNGSSALGYTAVHIKWNDNGLTTGRISVLSGNCEASHINGSSKSQEYDILTLASVQPSHIRGSINLSVGAKTNLSYEVDEISYLGTSIEAGYEWQVPPGWTIVSSNTEVLTVNADSHSGGLLRVRAKSACPNGLDGRWRPTTIVRSVPTPGNMSGPDYVTCADRNSKTYSVPAVTGATSYEWVLPLGWTGASTSRSISVIPNGSNGGIIKVRARSNNVRSDYREKNISLELYNPAQPPNVRGPGFVCTSSSKFDLQNPPTYTSISWSRSSNLQYVSGQGTGNYYVRALNSSTRGSGWVRATITTACGSYSKTKTVWVGAPTNAQASNLSGSTNVSSQSLYSFQMQPVSGATAYKWYLPSDWSIFNGGTSTHLKTWTGQSGGYKTLVCKPTNTCDTNGSTVVGGSLRVYVNTGSGGGPCPNPPCQIGPALIAYPNPAKDILSLELNASDTDFATSSTEDLDLPNDKTAKRTISSASSDQQKTIYNITLYDSGNRVVYQNKSEFDNGVSIDTKTFQNGMYFLIIDDGQSTIKRQIVVSN